MSFIDQAFLEWAALDEKHLLPAIRRELAELERRERVYRAERAPLVVAGRDVILVDDGLATGWTMRAAAESVRRGGAHSIVAAIPVAAPDAIPELIDRVDRVVCPLVPKRFVAVSDWYRDFAPVGDEIVRSLLAAQSGGPVPGLPTPSPLPRLPS